MKRFPLFIGMGVMIVMIAVVRTLQAREKILNRFYEVRSSELSG